MPVHHHQFQLETFRIMSVWSPCKRIMTSTLRPQSSTLLWELAWCRNPHTGTESTKIPLSRALSVMCTGISISPTAVTWGNQAFMTTGVGKWSRFTSSGIFYCSVNLWLLASSHLSAAGSSRHRSGTGAPTPSLPYQALTCLYEHRRRGGGGGGLSDKFTSLGLM